MQYLNLLTVLLVLICFSISSSCRKQEDPKMQQLQKDVSRLLQENEKLEKQVTILKEELKKQESRRVIPQSAATAPRKVEPEMTIDRMKAELEPTLNQIIQKLKAASETPRRGNQFGMRVEYDLKRAIYGLVRNDDPVTPYSAKVIIRYEKFLESERSSESYGTGTVQFIFAYINGHWFLMNYQ